jgi:inosine/xanthosine triphosphatase
MLIAVGSTNPTKIAPVEEIFRYHFGVDGAHIQVKGVTVNSGVGEQPMSDDEMFRGAMNRAKAALKKVKNAEYGVGIEGGLHRYGYGWFERSTVVILNREGKFGVGSSGGLALPDSIMEKIHDGKNLEEAVDEIFGTSQVGEGIGMFGLMTRGAVTRAEGVKHGVAFALARFLHEGLYR